MNPTDTPVTTPRPRLLPWLLRLHRPGLAVWAALVAVLTLTLLAMWGPLGDAAADGWRQYRACVGDGPCGYDQDAIIRYRDVYTYTTFAVIGLPFLVAAWAGAALVGREMESGTAHLAWTTGLSPTRWLAAKLAAPAALVAVGTGLLVLLHHLAWSANRNRIDTSKSWHDSPTLHANGPTTVALALAGLAAGALAGLLWRRTLPALVAGLGFTVVLRVAADLAMPHLWPTVTRVTGLDTGYVMEGVEVDSGLVTAHGAHIADPGCGPTFVEGCAEMYAKLDATGFYREYHPESHYWPLQLTTTALLLAVAAGLTVTAFALLRRSTATTRTPSPTPTPDPAPTREEAAV
ncbi:ABC transporter permease [Streptomyces phaeoluteigriseus]|uniref:ABC transporter permease n=1 Tax=Streptomyces phaeoluteigriseus TaxID=114686 RepID=A0ABY4ZJD0_9ACTN|nr:ABC transporter permease [Streptomyces phaeoluteigriseus]USQ89122.1 ABC transporter permease [Streptomyces phaeoluteigriseus]